MTEKGFREVLEGVEGRDGRLQTEPLLAKVLSGLQAIQQDLPPSWQPRG